MANMDQTKYEAKAEDIAHLREWLKKVPHVPQDFGDGRLRDFLTACKNSLQKTKLVLENYCSLHHRDPDFWGEMDPLSDTALNNFKVARFYPLRQKTKDDCIVFVLQLREGNHDPYLFSYKEQLRNVLRAMMIYSLEGNAGSGKIRLILDNRDTVMTHAREVTPKNIISWYSVLETSLPIRLQGSHGINVPKPIEWLYALSKSLVSGKMSERIHVHRDIESLKNFVSPEILPKELGGCGESAEVLFGEWRKKLTRYRSEILLEESKLRALGHLIPKNQYPNDMDGSFRRLIID